MSHSDLELSELLEVVKNLEVTEGTTETEGQRVRSATESRASASTPCPQTGQGLWSPHDGSPPVTRTSRSTLNTPSRDPLAEFNSWVRANTPTMHSRTETPVPITPHNMRSTTMIHPTGMFHSSSMKHVSDTQSNTGSHSVMGMTGTPPGVHASPLSVSSLMRDPASAGSPGVQLFSERGRGYGGGYTEYKDEESLVHGMVGYEDDEREASKRRIAPHRMHNHHHHLGFSPSHSQPITIVPVPLVSFRSRVAQTAMEQVGCRQLQLSIDHITDPSELIWVVEEVCPVIEKLMIDAYGNFLVQKLLEMANNECRIALTQAAAPSLPFIATTAHGTFAVQKMVESLRNQEEENIVMAGLASNIPLLLTDPNGGHVVLKMLNSSQIRHGLQFLYDGICASVVAISNDKQGCCTVQKCIDNASQSQFIQVKDAVIHQILYLAPNPYGNYVVQNVIRKLHSQRLHDEVDAAALRVSTHLPPLCTNKFSSNVVELILRMSTAKGAVAIVHNLCDPEALALLSCDNFGNYVVQTALSRGNAVPPSERKVLAESLIPLLPNIRKTGFAKKIEAKVEQTLGLPPSTSTTATATDSPSRSWTASSRSSPPKGAYVMSTPTRFNCNAQPFTPGMTLSPDRGNLDSKSPQAFLSSEE